MNVFKTIIASPLGPLELTGNETGLLKIAYTTLQKPRTKTTATIPLLNETTAQLNAYFEGRLKRFDLPLSPEGTTFQKKVWLLLRTIPYGHTLSYKQQALKLGNLKAIRAVASANGKNPLSIIVPCHRVIGSNGALTGYAGGLWRKEWLLKHEGILTQRRLF